MQSSFVQQGMGRDEQIISAFQENAYWGLIANIDLFGCHPDPIRSPMAIERWVKELCAFIRMERYGEPLIVRFGKLDLYGYSAVQLIETSSVTAHFIEPSNDACIDIFSCSSFGPYAAGEFCRQFFGASSVTVTYHFRGQRVGEQEERLAPGVAPDKR